MLKRLLTLAVVMLYSFAATAFDPLKGRPSHFSIFVTNPLSGMSKYGGIAEVRLTQSAFAFGLTNYVGAYQGVQFKLEYIKYIKTRYRNESFWYLKALSGNAQFESAKLSFLGEERDFQVGPVDYHGFGGGVGRRWNLNHFVIAMNAGAKYVFFPKDFTDQEREHFRYFYTTGPGSVVELNFRFGYQFY